MKLNKIGLILILIMGIIPTLIFSQTIVQISKTNSLNLNKLEKLEVNHVFEMEDYVVISPKSSSLLDEAKIEYRVLTSDNRNNPLYLVSAKPGFILNSQPYLAEILINDAVRVERASSSNKRYLPQDGIKFVPVRISSQLYQNKTRKYKNLSANNQEINRNLDEVLASVNADSVAWYIQELEDFDTRYALLPNRREISEWIASQFTRFGYENVAIDSFYVDNYDIWQYNVVCIEEGSVNPDTYVVVGGHHDSIITPNSQEAYTFAPGADDNASGVAAVLETARILKLHNVQARNSIRFVTFAMEEFGLFGGYHDAEYLAENNIDVIAMLNSDMISNHTAEDYIFTVRAYPGAESLTNLTLTNSSDLEMNTIPLNTSLSGSDSWAYHSNGFPAIFFSEYEFSPYYHSFEDISENTNPDYAAQFIKLVASTTISVGNLLAPPENFRVEDVGDGSTINATWDAVNEVEITYVLEVKNLTTNEVVTFYTEGITYSITDLTNNTPYGITLFADLDDVLSFGETRFITPQNIPSQVQGFTYEALVGQIDFAWVPNSELDLTGYKLYRKTLEESEFSLIANLNSDETTYSDVTTQSGVWYDYVITAFDQDGNESEFTEVISTRHLSFDSGIAIFDFTSFSETNLFNPPQQLVEEFYADILINFSYDHIICDPQEALKVEDLGIYSTVIIMRNSFTGLTNFTLKDAIEGYLELGGKLLISATSPIQFLDLNNNTYPKSFVEGDLVYDRFGIDEVDNNSTARFARAQSLAWNIPDLEVEPSKIYPTFNNRIYNLEAFSTYNDPSVENILSYQSDSDNSVQNVFDDYIVAVSKNYGNSKVIVTSLPLYFIKTNQARQFMDVALNYLDEAVANENNEATPINNNLRLSNYPNPFNPDTTISFSLPNKSSIKLKIYNLKGQLVKSMNRKNLDSGYHVLTWNGESNSGDKLSSGIYLYRLETESGLSQTKRMVLLK